MSEVARLTIAPIELPASLDDADAEPFLAISRIGNAVCRHDAGHDDLDEDPAEVWGFWRDTADWTHLGFAAGIYGTTLGVGTLTIATQAGTSIADFDVWVDPERWGDGIEEALLAEVEAEARRRGLRVLQTWTLHRPGGADPLVPTTGWGSVPAGDRHAGFYRSHGFALEQVERNSVFDLHSSFDRVERMLRHARSRAGAEYRSIHWTGATPDPYLDSFAYTISRMSTDAPQGGLDIDEQRWDAERARRREARMASQGLTVSVAATLHEPTGTIAAYNELVIGENHSGATQQYGTLVLAEHRGRRLGTIVKCENLLRWRELMPTSPRVSTFNAEENRHMLSINEAIGFVPVSYAGAWQRVLGG